MNRSNIFRLETRTGEAATIGGTAITPQSQALIIRLPFCGFVWNRPVAVIVDRAEQVERVPITDVTRLVTWGLIGLSLVFSVIMSVLVMHRKESHHE